VDASDSIGAFLIEMNTEKYIELIKSSPLYRQVVCGDFDMSTVKYTSGDNKDEIIEHENALGSIYSRKQSIKTYAKWDDISNKVLPYNKYEDKQWRHYLYVNSFVISYLNRNTEYDENIWLYIRKEIQDKFRYCLSKTTDPNILSVDLAAACEEIFHNQIDEDGLSGTIAKHVKKLNVSLKSNRSFKLAFDGKWYDDDRLIGINNGLYRHRKLESLTLKRWFKEIFPQCKTRDEVIQKMSEKIGSNFSLSSYKTYKAEMFPGDNKEHKERVVEKPYNKTNKQMEKEKNKIEEAANKIYKLKQTYGDKWKKYVDSGLLKFYYRKYKEIDDLIDKVIDFE